MCFLCFCAGKWYIYFRKIAGKYTSFKQKCWKNLQKVVATLNISWRWFVGINYSLSLYIYVSDVSRVFLVRPVHTLKQGRCHHGWCREEIFSKFMPPDALKIHYPALSVLRFPCKTLSKTIKFTLQNTPLWGWFLKNLYIHMAFK